VTRRVPQVSLAPTARDGVSIQLLLAISIRSVIEPTDERLLECRPRYSQFAQHVDGTLAEVSCLKL
jgi:hypothetical protein